MDYKALLEFVTNVQNLHSGVEAVAVADETQLLFEHHFTQDMPRNIYSHTKSFTSTAVGLAIAEGALALTDRPADFFAENLPQGYDHRWDDVTLEDCLMMASGAQQSLMMGNRYAGEGFPDYLRYIFSHPIQCEPGTKHHYSNGDTYLCGRMVEKAVGKTLIAYLYEKIFQPMGMRYPTWEMDPYGHSFGASGLYMTIGDMIKLGQLYLAKGNWQGKQLVDSAWIDAAGACQINTAGEQNIWTCGYGYQFWKLGFPDAYRADGAYGQITAILPAKGLTVSIQCAESGDFGLTQPAFIKLLAEI